MEATQVASIAFSLADFALFGVVARAVARREVSPQVRGANRAFVLWWGAIAVSSLFTASVMALTAAGAMPLPLYRGFQMANLVLVCAALWGLLHYLLVLIADVRRLAVPLALLYAGLAAYLAWIVFGTPYDRVALGDWTVSPEPQPQFSEGYVLLLLSLILGPQLLAALAYLTLWFRVDDRVARKRILIVSLSILGWFGSAFAVAIAQGSAAAENDAWQWASRLIGLAAAGAILYAYVGLTPKAGAPQGTGGDVAAAIAAEDAQAQDPEGRRLAPRPPAARPRPPHPALA